MRPTPVFIGSRMSEICLYCTFTTCLMTGDLNCLWDLLVTFVVGDAVGVLLLNYFACDKLFLKSRPQTVDTRLTYRLPPTWWPIQLPPSRRLFSPLSVYLFVCLFVNRITKTTDQMPIKFYGMVGHNARPNRLDFEWPWIKVKVTRGKKKSESFFCE